MADLRIGNQFPTFITYGALNVEEGQKVLKDSGLNFLVANGMKDAADKAVVAAAGN